MATVRLPAHMRQTTTMIIRTGMITNTISISLILRLSISFNWQASSNAPS